MDKRARAQLPDRLVALTFDDGSISDRTLIGPLLKQCGFGATFFVNKGGGAFKQSERYMSWDDVKWLSDAGFEIGNHTYTHDIFRVGPNSKERFAKDIEALENEFSIHNIPRAESFCYCRFRHTSSAVKVLQEKKYTYGRRGVAPEFKCTDMGDRGPTYEPLRHHPLLLPTTGTVGPNFTFNDFIWAVEQAKNNKIAILCFHGIPDIHPNISIESDTFKKYMGYLYTNDYIVVALRDMKKYVTWYRI